MPSDPAPGAGSSTAAAGTPALGWAGVDIRRARVTDVAGLAAVLVDCVTTGASVGFMLPLERARAERFWASMLESEARGERLVWVAEERAGGTVVGTAQVVLSAPENQPHRGEVAKVLVHRSARRRGVAEGLMRVAEAGAAAAGKTLLVLDTADEGAERLYRRLGWRAVGAIPGYALAPGGGAVDTVVYYRDLTA